MKAIVTLLGPDNLPAEAKVMVDRQDEYFNVRTDYLVSAGQSMRVRVVIHDYDKVPDSRLPEVLGLVEIDHSWDFSLVPTARTLSEILADVVDHVRTDPTHGSDCICMDQYVREIRVHVSKAIPPDTRPDRIDQADIHDRVEARARVSGVLYRVWRNM